MSTCIVSTKQYVAGWLDTSIHELFEVFSATRETRFALITRVDSHPRPAELLRSSPELKSLARSGRVLGDAILTPTSRLLKRGDRRRLFFGFDEVWLFPDEDVEPKPAGCALVGPARVDRRSLRKLSRWMSENSCALGLGDGVGLNFVVPAQGIAKFLLGTSIDQPATPAVATAGA
jgi:hypothetical protein